MITHRFIFISIVSLLRKGGGIFAQQDSCDVVITPPVTKAELKDKIDLVFV